jgi:plasmid stability protein
MASMTIRNIDDGVKHDLRQIAARNGHSLEEEARRALTAHARPQPVQHRESIGQMIYRMSRPGFDLPELPDSPIDFAKLEAE